MLSPLVGVNHQPTRLRSDAITFAGRLNRMAAFGAKSGILIASAAAWAKGACFDDVRGVRGDLGRTPRFHVLKAGTVGEPRRRRVQLACAPGSVLSRGRVPRLTLVGTVRLRFLASHKLDAEEASQPTETAAQDPAEDRDNNDQHGILRLDLLLLLLREFHVRV